MRYRLEFTDKNNGQYRVDIFNNNLGNWKELCGSEMPLNIRSTRGDMLDTILGTGVEIGIMVRNYDTITQSEFEALFTSPPQTFKVEVYKDNVIVFTGFVDTEMYQESYVYPPYEITLSASDGLKSLKNYEPSLNAYEKLSDIVTKCLLKTGLDLPIWAMNTLTSEDVAITSGSFADFSGFMNSQNKSIYQLSQCSISAFPKKDALSILEGVLKSFKCKIYQQNGEWRIDRMSDKYYRGYNLREICLNKTLPIRTRILTPYVVKDEFVGRGQTLEVNSPYGKQTIVGNDENRDSINDPVAKTIKYSLFQQYDNQLAYFSYALNELKRGEPTSTTGAAPYILKGAVDMKNINGKYIFVPPKMVDRYRYKGTIISNRRYSFNDMLHLYPPSENKTVDVRGEPYGFPYMPYSTFNRRLIERNAISFPSWNKNYMADALEISAKLNFKLRPNALDDHNWFNYFPDEELKKEWDKDASQGWVGSSVGVNNVPVVGIYYRIRFGENDYLLFDPKKGFSIGASIGEGVWLSFDKEVKPDDESMDISIKINQSTDISTDINVIKINETLSKYNDITIEIICPYSAYRFAYTGANRIIQVKMFNDINFIGDTSISDLNIGVKESVKYNNTYTGTLQQNYLREADQIEIDLWNPVKLGDSKELRGLVSSTSKWVNFNKATNIYNASGIYADQSNLDQNSGLGLWYDLRELQAHNFITTDLGHRLPVVLLNGWFNQFSETQDIISGTIFSNNLLNFDTTYKIGGRGNKQFMMITRNYNCKTLQISSVFHELKDEEVTTNV